MSVSIISGHSDDNEDDDETHNKNDADDGDENPKYDADDDGDDELLVGH